MLSTNSVLSTFDVEITLLTARELWASSSEGTPALRENSN